MKKSAFFLLLVLLALPHTPVLADCVNCWVNPITGKQESFGNNNTSQSAIVEVYGTNRCPLTVRLLQSLRQQNIPYQFKNLDQPNVSQEYFQLMRQQNLTEDNRIPKVYINGQVLTRPSVNEIQAINQN